MGNIYKHIFSVFVFISLTVYLFNPLFFENKIIKQHDIEQWIYSANETIEFREKNNEEALWSNSMFSGMPAYLIDIQWSNDIVKSFHKVYSLFFPHPVSNLIISFISFYFMLLCFRVRPEISLFGSIGFTLSSYIIIGILAGHNARIGTIAFLPLIIAGTHMCIHNNRNLGFIITAVGLALQLRLNHLQITYYTLIILIFYGVNLIISFYYDNNLRKLSKRIGILLLAVMLSIGTFFGHLWSVFEYSNESIRGKSELTNNTSGLEKDYAFQYSNGIFEPLTLFIPNILGGSSRQILERDSNLGEALRKNNVSTVQINNQLRNVPTYWGDQPLTAPYYAGALSLFLLILGILILEKKEKNWILALLTISVLLSMGSNFSSLNNLFFDYLPGYNKFRSVTFIIIISLFSVALFSSLTLEKFFSDIKKHKTNLLKAFYITLGFYFFIYIVSFTLNFSGSVDTNFTNFPNWFLDALIEDRKDLLFKNIIFGSFITLIFVSSVLIINYKNLSLNIAFILINILMIFDHLSLNSKLIRDDKTCELYGDCVFISKKNSDFQLNQSDEYILEDNTQNKRVFNLQNPFNEAKTSYYHSSIGGYHGAKIRRYQDLIERNINNERNSLVTKLQENNRDFSDLNVLNMLNVGYFKFGENKNNVVKNTFSKGKSWFVNNIIKVNSPLDEINNLNNFDSKNDAILDISNFKLEKNDTNYSQDGSIKVLEYSPNKIIYETQNSSDAFIVFSEIFYPHGWEVYINNEKGKLLRVNYILRGLELGKGINKIEMTFKPAAYTTGNKIILGSNIIILLLLVFISIAEIKKYLK